MAVILYSNGIAEEYKPRNLVFTEEEILHLFKSYPEIITCRVANILNTWCVYGKNKDPLEFNRIASDIIEKAVYSHILFIHDSEINTKWNATDSILYKDYKEFLVVLKREIEHCATNIMDEYTEHMQQEGGVDVLPQLITLGTTNDKRLLFGFDPEDQPKNFYDNQEFNIFSQKVFEYISKNRPKTEPFVIYADNKAIIIIETLRVEQFLTTLIENFKGTEDYETCTQITKIKEDWVKIASKPKAQRTRKPRAPRNDGKKLNGK